MCQRFQYEEASQGEIIFNYEDVCNNKYYVILSGQVGVIYPKKEPKQSSKSQPKSTKPKANIKTKPFNRDENEEMDDENTPKDSDTQIERQSTLRKLFSSKSSKGMSINKKELTDLANDLEPWVLPIHELSSLIEDQELPEIFQNNKKFEKEVSKLGDLIGILDEGDSFGDLVLQSESTRSFSVLCKTKCELMVVHKQHFEAIFAQKLQDKKDFFFGLFPFLISPSVSVVTTNYILYSFKVTNLQNLFS